MVLMYLQYFIVADFELDEAQDNIVFTDFCAPSVPHLHTPFDPRVTWR